MKNLILLSLISTSFAVAGCSVSNKIGKQESQILQQTNAVNIKKLFDSANSKGIIVIQDKDKTTVYGNSFERAKTEYVPASTFKLLNALIGLEYNKTNPTEVFKWDGQKKNLSAWEKDMTLGEGMKVSNVPLYQELARRIGLERMQNEVKKVNYGNNNIGSKVDDFWLVGPLKITPFQEADFAYRLANKTLPFKQSVQEEVQRIAFLKEQNGKKIYGKTGLGADGETKVGWLTGWVEQPNGDKTSFSLNMEMQPNTPYEIRNEIVYKSLEQLGIV